MIPMSDMNWRKGATYVAFRLTRSEALERMRTVDRISSMSRSDVQKYQKQRLTDLLKHAYQTVPYYNEILSDAGVIDDGSVNLDRYSDIPLLTKDELRSENDRLRSSDPNSGVYKNTSGGTTGEPVEFLQDDEYLAWTNGNRRYYHRMAGRDLGEPWAKLWGDESEVFGERQSLKDEFADFILNRHFLNSYRMGETEMAEHVERINDIQPKSMEVYVESIDELAKYIDNHELNIHSPNGILSTAGTLHQPVRERVERVFDTTVLNKYGSREVGTMACECPHQEGLHIFDHTHYIEVVDEEGNPLPPGEEGELAITLLTNYTMPLIRYRIGDMGIMKEGQCSCGRPFTMLKNVTGRVIDHFLTTDERLVHGQLLIHLLYYKPWIKKFQVRQTAQDRVLFRIVLNEGKSPPQSDLDEIESKTQKALGEGVTVDFKFPNEIEPSDSGKYRYTISEVV